MNLFSCILLTIPWVKAFLVRSPSITHKSWFEFYQNEQKTKINQAEFNDYSYTSDASYYLKNLIVKHLTKNAINIEDKSNVKILVETCSFSDIVTSIPAIFGQVNWKDTKAGAIWFESSNSQCVINKCSADTCYNKLNPSYYYLDGANFANFRSTSNKILSTTIQSCAPDYYGVNAFRSRDSSGNYTGLNISSCKSSNLKCKSRTKVSLT
ncbi:hypothetical protein TVAG_448130 [Trichomonas vaginalis G3]|uniref:Uncharacterized protein n=1 Tax=Trichomonas vaginalis (strain ATCC PRA-98 / G3) TaxID=412133 RepID=A2FQK3_TRIV3|nr:hypothetical protein TVAGG3_0145490 [Trichomonas vaginalis G3]EAX92816.1 hypothetical protein TVAG_448130 [Trichomonas vaginalis G3]KAI5546892.1 hypothetical protein TVAGG3_0145490 [Trichomonas vaginalis G3]|eukprot:XP_001305746.1 hypothetical protein [Trichomonas vaginalis G3]